MIYLENAEDLADQSDIHYGTLADGSTMTFFRLGLPSFVITRTLISIVVQLYNEIIGLIVNIQKKEIKQIL